MLAALALFALPVAHAWTTDPANVPCAPSNARRCFIGSLPFLTGSVLLPSHADTSVTAPLFRTVDDVPAEYFSEHKSIVARVRRVIDGDTIRVEHCQCQTSLTDCTLKVRLYGVDAPELAKSKNQTAQAFAEESKEFVMKAVGNQMVQITFLKKDRYSRAVCEVKTIATDKTPSVDLSLALVSLGLAEMYTGGGASYNGKKQLIESLQASAKEKKLGIWSLGEDMISAKEGKMCLRNGYSDFNCMRPAIQ